MREIDVWSEKGDISRSVKERKGGQEMMKKWRGKVCSVRVGREMDDQMGENGRDRMKRG